MLRVEPFRIDTPRYDVWCDDLPSELDGLAICQISDLHISEIPRNEAAIAKALRAIPADLYVFTGDMVFLQTGVSAFFRWLDDLGDAVKPAVAILGNAEYKEYVNLEEILTGFSTRNIPVLQNRTLNLNIKGVTLQIVGVDDPHSHHSNFSIAYANADPSAWTLLLFHSPDGITQLNGYRADLMLCGHTHGGQVRLPLIGALHTNLRRAKRLVSGWYSGSALAPNATASARLYVSRGLGGGGYAGRLLCRPELPTFILRCK